MGGCAAAQPTGKRAKMWNWRWGEREKKSGAGARSWDVQIFFIDLTNPQVLAFLKHMNAPK